MRIGFLMDPLDQVRVDHDSTFALMLECRRRGLEVRELRQEWLFAMNGRCWSRMRTVSVRRATPHFEVEADRSAPLAELDVLFLRKDPPVDVAFLHATQLVELGEGPVLINQPAGLRAANEKLFAMRYPELMPATVLTRDRDKIQTFIDRHGGEAVLKPLDGFGGQGVFRARSAEDARITDELWMVQEFVPAVETGDKRVIVVDGEPVGAILRVPPRGAFLANMAAGGKATRCPVDARDRQICARLAPELRRSGLFFAGIDVIGGLLTEVNVTSPTGLVEIEALGGGNVAALLVDFALGRARSGARAAV